MVIQRWIGFWSVMVIMNSLPITNIKVLNIVCRVKKIMINSRIAVVKQNQTVKPKKISVVDFNGDGKCAN